jgi:hypothetical protein
VHIQTQHCGGEGGGGTGVDVERKGAAGLDGGCGELGEDRVLKGLDDELAGGEEGGLQRDLGDAALVVFERLAGQASGGRGGVRCW